jgi:2-dehydropantoate 2-reductase
MNQQTKPTLVVAGSGAMGCLFGGLLAEGGLNVTLLDVWPEHIAAINKAGGLRFVGFGGERLVKLSATTDASSIKSADVVFFQCKALYNETAAKSVRHLFGGNTVAISFQNGLGNEQVIAGVVGEKNVLAGLTSQAASIEGPGVVRNYAELPSSIGELKAGLTERVSRLARVFTEHGLPTEAKEDVIRDKWKKLFANISFSATSGATDLTLGEVAAHPELRVIALRAIDEAAAVAAADGVKFTQEQSREIFHQLVGPNGSATNKSSMCRDIHYRRPSEVDYIYGTVAKMGHKYKVPTPTLDALIAVIKGIESHYVGKEPAKFAAVR